MRELKRTLCLNRYCTLGKTIQPKYKLQEFIYWARIIFKAEIFYFTKIVFSTRNSAKYQKELTNLNEETHVIEEKTTKFEGVTRVNEEELTIPKNIRPKFQGKRLQLIKRPFYLTQRRLL